MIYCYGRVSTQQQNLDRQLVEFEKYKPYKLVTDKESGKRTLKWGNKGGKAK